MKWWQWIFFWYALGMVLMCVVISCQSKTQRRCSASYAGTGIWVTWGHGKHTHHACVPASALSEFSE